MSKGEKIFIGVFVGLLLTVVIISTIVKSSKKEDKWQEITTEDTTEVAYDTEEQVTEDYNYYNNQTTETRSTQQSTQNNTTTTEKTPTVVTPKEDSYWLSIKKMMMGTSNSNYEDVTFGEKELISMVVRGTLQGYANTCPFLPDELKSTKLVDTQYDIMSSNIDTETHTFMGNIVDNNGDIKVININYDVDIENQQITKLEVTSIEDYVPPTTEEITTEAQQEPYWVTTNFYMEDENNNNVLAEETFIACIIQGINDNHLYDCLYATDEIKQLDLTSYDFTDSIINITTNEITLKDGTVFEYDYVEEPALTLTKLQVKEG